jgi:hypothetical protein
MTNAHPTDTMPTRVGVVYEPLAVAEPFGLRAGAAARPGSCKFSRSSSLKNPGSALIAHS